MAQTYTYADALNFLRTQIPATTEDQKAATICNIGTNLIWNAYDWRETMAILPPFWLSPLIQDYGQPLIAVPTNFLGLREAQLTDLSTVPPAHYPIRVMKFLEPTATIGLPSDISYEPSTHAFRVYPRVPAALGASRFKIDGVYKIRPTLVTAANYTSTTLPFDDLYFQVWLEVLRWAAMSATGNQNQGAATKGPAGQTLYSGQLATAMGFINSMAANEGMNLGDTTVAPSQGLSVGSGSGIWWSRNFLS